MSVVVVVGERRSASSERVGVVVVEYIAQYEKAGVVETVDGERRLLDFQGVVGNGVEGARRVRPVHDDEEHPDEM